ncbi:MAG: polymer-forming cytoskeletal protein [Rhodospirillaceae bacterium]|nr:polymer-forming cytoskeletal protein [Rhodospirillaceae bacterium]
MFSKVNKSGQPGAVHDSPHPSVKAGIPSIISADLRITGDLVCSGDVQIDGWVEGDIQSRNITIGEGATVQGGLQAESVRICGLVNGEVRADMVVLEKTARVTGDILHKSLAIEQGAYLEGMCRRTDTHPVTAVATSVEPVKDMVKDVVEKKAVSG